MPFRQDPRNLLTKRSLTAAIKSAGATDRQKEALGFQRREARLGREYQSAEAKRSFGRKTGFAREMLGRLSPQQETGGTGPPQVSESEKILIQSQEEAGEKELNRLQDVLSGAGVYSSGSLGRYSSEILGATRGAVAKTSAGFAESRLTRRHQERIAQQQQMTQLIASVLA